MARSAQLKKMSINHNAILDFLMANPTMRKGDVATHFGVSRSWLSIVINSDAFKDAMKLREDEFFGESVIPLREKLLGVAEQALERVEQHVATMKPEHAIETADKLLNRLGYAPNTKVNGQIPPGQGVINIQNNFAVSADTLRRAQNNFGKATNNVAASPQLIEQGLDNEQSNDQFHTAETIQSGGSPGVGETLEDGTSLCEGASEAFKNEDAEGLGL